MLDLTKVNWNKLYYYYLVGQYKNITEAARSANVFQSSLSRQMKQLEDELGTPLLKRIKTGVLFTETGESVYKAVCDMYNSALMKNNKLHLVQNNVSGTLRVLTTYLGTQKHLSHMPGFYDKFPQIRLQLTTREDLNNSNFLDDYDIAILDKYVENPEYDYIPFKSFKIGLFASKAYLQKYGTPKKLEDLSHHKLISFSPNILPKGSLLDFPLNLGGKIDKGFPVAYFQVGSFEALLEACRNDMGIISYVDETDFPLPPNVVKILDEHRCESLDLYFIFKIVHKDVRKIQEFIKFFKEI